MSVYRITAELKDYEPRMWRRLLVNEDTTVAQLGYIVLCVFKAECSHKMSIKKPASDTEKKDTVYEIPNQCGEKDCDDLLKSFSDRLYSVYPQMRSLPKKLDATKEKVKDALRLEKDADFLIINYDFGDDWNFKLTLDKILEKDEIKQKRYPCVTAGNGYGIIDDCGGVYGLMQIAEAAKLKEGSAYNEYRDRINFDTVDLSYFNKEELNELLKIKLESIQKAYENP